MKNKHLLKLFILGLTFAGLTIGLLRWAETETAAQKQDALLADNAWTGAAGSVWNTTAANWTNPAIWNNANTDSAIFSGAGAGAITVSEQITLRGMRFDANGYSLSGQLLSFASGGGGSLAPGEINVATGVSAQIANQIGSTAGLTKTGAGSLTISSNVGLGGLTINEGTLSTPGNNNNISVVNVNGGTYLPGTGGSISELNVSGGTFGPSGSVACSQVVLNSGTLAAGCNVANPHGIWTTGGTISPGGQGAVGAVVANRMTLNSATTLHIEIDASGADQLIAFAYASFPANSIHLNGAQLTGALINGFNPAPGQQFTIVTKGGFVNGGGGIIGQFAQGSQVTFSGRRFAVTYTLGGVTLTALTVGKAPYDFDGDGKTDVSIFRPASGEWWISKSSGGNFAAQFGTSTDKLTPGDFTGDGKTDIAFFRPTTGEWFVLRSEDQSFYSYGFGTNGDVPVVGDFDGDNKADTSVFRPSSSTWFIRKSSDGAAIIQQFGQSGDVPVSADYDGDNKADLAIYRPSSGEWWIQRSTAGLIAFQFGTAADKPVHGQYTADGKADVAFFRPSTGEWFVLRSEDQSYFTYPFGTTGDVPAPGDYDGDGKFDAAIFRPSTNTWYAQRTTAGTLIQSFGQSGDKAVPNAFVP